MTPIEIFEYKNRWKPNGHSVRIHSDYRSQAKFWCKYNFEPHQWVLNEYTDNYEDTFLFENPLNAKLFRKNFK